MCSVHIRENEEQGMPYVCVCVRASVCVSVRERDLQQYLISKVPSDRVTMFFFGRVIEASNKEKRYFFCYHLLATCSHNPHLLVVFCWCSVTNRNDRKVRRSQMYNTFCYLQPTFFMKQVWLRLLCFVLFAIIKLLY